MENPDNNENLKLKAWTLCKDFIGGIWKEISPEEIIISKLSGGFSNELYLCSLPSDRAAEKSQNPESVLMRIYGVIQEDPNAVMQEIVTFMFMSERKLGPKLYGVFPKGRLEEYIPSHHLSCDEMRQFSLTVAHKLAKLHALNVPLRKVPDMYENYFKKWLDDSKEALLERKENALMSYNWFKKECEWINSEMKQSKSLVVFCHNDLQKGNILCRENASGNTPELLFIDYELASYNYNIFDIAYYFNERCYDYDVKEYPYYRMQLENFPNHEEQVEFITCYLQQLVKEGVQLRYFFEEEMQIIMDNILLFSASANLLAALWCLKMETCSKIPFSYKEHGESRITVYQKNKEDYLKSRKH